jgi:protein-S-isoprenylcysteine O-methyltransferase Ste14
MSSTKQANRAASADNPGVVVLPPVLYVGAIVVALVLRWPWPLPILRSTTALFWFGLALVVFAVAIAMWGRRTMLVAGTTVNPLRPSTAIVTDGPFRFTRNPLYFAMTVLYLGLTLMFNTWWGVVWLVPLLVVMHYGVILREERYLEQKFGETYRHYRSTVRRYI